MYYLPASVDFPASLAMPFNSSTDMVPSIWLPSGRPMAAVASVISTAPSEWVYSVCWRDTHTHTHTHIHIYIYIYTHTHTTCGVVIYQVLNPSIHFVSFVYADTEVEEWWKTNRKGLGAWLASNYSVLSASSIAVSLATHLWSVCQIMTTVFLFSCFYYEEFWFTGKKV